MIQESQEFVNVEVWVMVDDAGNYAMGADEDAMETDWDENIGNHAAQCSIRRVKIALKLPKPRAIIVKAEIPVESEKVSVIVS